MFHDMKGSAANIFRYGGESYLCFRILWKVQPMFQDALVLGYKTNDMNRSAVNV